MADSLQNAGQRAESDRIEIPPRSTCLSASSMFPSPTDQEMSALRKPFAVEKTQRSEAATLSQFFQERQAEEEVAKQLVHPHSQRWLDPPRKRRAASIPGGTEETFEWRDENQYTDDRAKVL